MLFRSTSLCPLTNFDGQAIWQDAQSPSADEIEARRQIFHAPYHAALATQIARVKQQHGFAILFDCHSVRSNIPFLFDGTLPIFSIGTDGGKTCDPLIEKTTREICAAAPDYDHVVNGRFKAGWTTRHYGKTHTGVHAIQLELTPRPYIDEAAPLASRAAPAPHLRPPLSPNLPSLNTLPP